MQSLKCDAIYRSSVYLCVVHPFVCDKRHELRKLAFFRRHAEGLVDVRRVKRSECVCVFLCVCVSVCHPDCSGFPGSNSKQKIDV